MISERSATGFQNEKRKRTLLIVTEHPPHSYRPAGERILHTAVASSSFFETVVVLSLRGVGKQDMTKKTRVEQPSGASLYPVKFVRGMLYPVAALFDPIKFLVLLVHGLLLSRRYKPLCILTSVPPLETAVSAWLLSKRSSSTLVIDLRDDWESAVDAQFGQFFPEAILHLMVTIANKIYSNALLIFAATQTIMNSIRRRGVATQTFLVPNGADTSVFFPKNASHAFSAGV